MNPKTPIIKKVKKLACPSSDKLSYINQHNKIINKYII